MWAAYCRRALSDLQPLDRANRRSGSGASGNSTAWHCEAQLQCKVVASGSAHCMRNYTPTVIATAMKVPSMQHLAQQAGQQRRQCRLRQVQAPPRMTRTAMPSSSHLPLAAIQRWSSSSSHRWASSSRWLKQTATAAGRRMQQVPNAAGEHTPEDWQP